MATPILKVKCSFLFTISLFVVSILSQSDTYIIHMNLSVMPKVFSDHHNWYIATLSSISDGSKGSIPITSKLVYTYKSCVQGFSASLTNSELDFLKKSTGYISSTRDRSLKVHTTHTPEFLGLSSVSGLWPASNFGEDVIIGVVDTGIWPESESFNDEGMSEIPSRWKGKCEFGTLSSSYLCNKKLIGARFFNKGQVANNPKLKNFMNSTRDTDGHGTHTSSIAAGNYVKEASYFGYASGTARGVAPKARIAMYKAVWNGVYESDALAAIDQAIEDGVDILSLSFGFYVADVLLLDKDTIAIATFAAMEKGIFVAVAAGNDGPAYFSLINGAPWLTTVAAGTVDRHLGGVLTFGNSNQIAFTSMYPGNFLVSQTPLIFMDGCPSVQELMKTKNKIIVCKGNIQSIRIQVVNVESAGVLGAVFITDIFLSEFYGIYRTSFPAAFIGIEEGDMLIHYIQNSKDPRGSLQFRNTVLGTKPAPMLAHYSSRGPFQSCRNVLKPDILAPGTLILASWPPTSPVAKVGSRPVFNKFNLISGTSMATPHVAGAAALIKKAHPDWSPAAIRSALTTTANSIDNTLSPIKDVASHNLPANPLGIGAGHINPIKSLDPGLIYDATADDYIKFLCAMKYTTKQIQIITRSTHSCLNKSLDLNYPSFFAYFNTYDYSSSSENYVQEFQRTLTSVGEGISSFTAKVTGLDGMKVSVEPRKLVFREKYEKLSYKLILQAPKQLNDEWLLHGSLSWIEDNGKYVVRSPIMATTLLPE